MSRGTQKKHRTKEPYKNNHIEIKQQEVLSMEKIMERVIESGCQKLKVKLDGNNLVGKMGADRSGRWIRIENPCDINGNPITQLPEGDYDLLDILMYNEIIKGQSPMLTFERYFYFLVNKDGELIYDCRQNTNKDDIENQSSNSGIKYEPSNENPIVSNVSPFFNKIFGKGE